MAAKQVTVSSALERLVRQQNTTAAAPKVKECVICTETKTFTQFKRVTSQCTHLRNVCTQCVRTYLKVEIAEKGRVGEDLLCPAPDCASPIADSEVRRFFKADNPVLASYERRSIERVLEADPAFRWCPTGCGSGQLVDDVSTSSFWTCAGCGARACVRHRTLFHDGMTCEEYDVSVTSRARAFPGRGALKRILRIFRRSYSRKVSTEEATEASAEEKRRIVLEKQEAASLAKMRKMGVKQCPSCKQALLKYTGCAHFTCGTSLGCKAEFCWLCLADYADIKDKGNKFHHKSCKFYA